MYRLDKLDSRQWLVTVDRNETGYTIVRVAACHYEIYRLGVLCKLSGTSIDEALSGARWLHIAELLRSL